MSFEKPTASQLEHRFTHHPPKSPEQVTQYENVRYAVLQAAKKLVDLTPVCPEQTRALNALDEAMFLANAAIARHS